MATLVKSVNKRKKEIEAVISKGKLKTKTEVAKQLNLCDSYVCRILKHKR